MGDRQREGERERGRQSGEMVREREMGTDRGREGKGARWGTDREGKKQ